MTFCTYDSHMNVLTRASKPLPKQKRLPNSTFAGLKSRFLPMISKDCGRSAAAGPAGMDIAAGEYGYDSFDFRRMMDAAQLLQADATRCAGITGFLAVGALCQAAPLLLSAPLIVLSIPRPMFNVRRSYHLPAQ